MYNPNKNIEKTKYLKTITKSEEEMTIKENIAMYTFPFEIQFIDDNNTNKFDIKFESKNNILYLKKVL